MKLKRKSRWKWSVATLKEKHPLLGAEIDFALAKMGSGVEYVERDGDTYLTDAAYAFLVDQLSTAPKPVLNPEPQEPSSGTDSAEVPKPPLGGRSPFVPNPDQDQHEMRVAALFPNPRILHAESPELGRQPVFVGNAANFKVGMALPVQRHPTEKAWWQLLGTLPRYVGRW